MIGTNLPPGTELICINAQPLHDRVPLVEGGLYTLRGYTEGPSGYIAVLLHEVRAPQINKAFFGNRERGFYRERFRPLNIPKIFYDMLDEVNSREEIKQLTYYKETE
jgi:hypothetical protein